MNATKPLQKIDDNGVGDTHVGDTSAVDSNVEEIKRGNVNNAIRKLEIAIEELNKSTGAVIENQRSEEEVDGQIQRLADDRAELARQLDTTQARADSLKEVNEQVSRRLVDVMEKIRYMNTE